MKEVRSQFEDAVFGVCSFLGRKLNMPSKNIRLFFVYGTFLTLGSPIIIYLVLAFLLKIKGMVNGKRNPVWDL